MKQIFKKSINAITILALALTTVAGFPGSVSASHTPPVITDEFSATISPTSSLASATQNYSVTVTNNPSSSDTVRSVGIIIPTGWTVANLSISSGWTATNLGPDIELQKIGNGNGNGLGLHPGDSIVVTFDGTAPAGAVSSEWTTTAFNGDHQTSPQFDAPPTQPTVTVTVPAPVPPPVYVTTQAADGISATDATLHALNGSSDAQGHSFWVSTSTFSTASPNIPSGVFSTPDFGAISSGQSFDAQASLTTTAGIPSNMSAIMPSTTYYYAAWSDVGGTWYPGQILNFTTSAAPLAPDTTPPSLPVHISPANGSTLTTAELTEIDWTTSVDASSSPVTYLYEVSNSTSTNPDGSFVSPVYTSGVLTVPDIQTPNTPEGTYYWHVKAVDAVGNATAWTNPWEIIVDNTVPPETGSLTVTNVVVGGALQVSDFPLFVDGSSVTSGIATTTSVGSHVVTETAQNGYTGVFSGDCDVNGNVTVSTSTTAACTLTNTFAVTPPTNVLVHIEKYVDGSSAAASSTLTAIFPMHSSWVATNLGTGSGDYTLAPSDSYEADTSPMTSGANYTTNETLDNVTTGSSCGSGNAYSLEGYSTGDSFADAASSTVTDVAPSFTNITSDQYVIVWNTTCAPVPTTGTLDVKKIVLDPEGATTTDDTSFTVSDGSSTASVAQDADAVFTNLAPGSYTVIESPLTGYDLVDVSPTSTVNVEAGATTTVTLTNKQQIIPTTAIINIHKITNPANTDQDFTFDLDEGTTTIATTTANAAGSDATFSSVAPGTYNLTEENTPLWAFSGSNCTYEGSEDTGVTAFQGEELTVAAGDVVDCTFTNTATGGAIQVIKQVLASDGSTIASDDKTPFTIDINGFDQDTISQNSDVIHTGVLPGNYTVNENPNSNYTLVSISPDNDSDTPGGQFTVVNGTTTVVTIVNEQVASTTGTIIVHKVTNPANTDQDFTFNLSEGDDEFIATSTANAGSSDASSTDATFANLPAGTYELSENQLDGWNFNNVNCQSGDETVGESSESEESLTVEPGETINCTFTNTTTTGTIEVVKDVVDSNGNPVTDTHPFSVTLDGTSTETVAEGTNAVYSGLDPEETYTIAENSDPSYSLVSISPTSTVSVEAGTTTVVTITNMQNATTSPQISSTIPPPPSDGTNGGGGGGPTAFSTSGSTGGSTGSGQGQVLGASTDTTGTGGSCDLSKIIGTYLGIGKANNKADVIKLQTFLNTQDLGVTIPVTGFFGPITEHAVELFQIKYADQILGPWVTAGLYPNETTPTGYVYKTTLRWINLLICSDLNIPVPKLP